MCTQGSESDCLKVNTAVEDSMLCLLCEGTGLWSCPGLAFTAKSASIMVPLSHGASQSWCLSVMVPLSHGASQSWCLSVMVLTFPMLRLTINRLMINTSFARHCSAW